MRAFLGGQFVGVIIFSVSFVNDKYKLDVITGTIEVDYTHENGIKRKGKMFVCLKI